MSQNRYDALLLENQLCFPLYAASREVIKRHRTQLDELGLTYTQYVALMVIWEETTVSVRDLGRRLYLDSGTLTPVLKTLEKANLITRQRSREDERVLLVTITKEGLALREQALAIHAPTADCVGLTAEESAELHRLLNKVLASSDNK